MTQASTLPNQIRFASMRIASGGRAASKLVIASPLISEVGQLIAHLQG
jgi:hypothetical protein